VTGEEALLRLAESTAEAVQTVLETFAPGRVERGVAAVIPRGSSPFQSLPLPAVAAAVRYVGGVTGGNVFLLSRLGARRLAALMMGSPPEEAAEGELSELELSAVAEAMNQMMAAAAAATGAVLGQEIDISPPETRPVLRREELSDHYEATPWAASVSFRVADEPGRLVQLVPNAFVVRMTRALDELGVAEATAGSDGAGQGSLAPASLLRLPVRLSAELGRARLPLRRAVALAGQVVELDRRVEDPIEILLNGRPFALGRLLVADGEWAVRIETITAPESALALRRGNLDTET
jgi:flagellar motor switch protein FliN/FliY